MDHYVTGAPLLAPAQLRVRRPGVVGRTGSYAAQGALADRYFQPIAGQSRRTTCTSRARSSCSPTTQFTRRAIGQECSIEHDPMSFEGPTIGDLLDDARRVVGLVRRGLPGDGRLARSRPVPAGARRLRLRRRASIRASSTSATTRSTTTRTSPTSPTYLRDYAKLQADLDNGDAAAGRVRARASAITASTRASARRISRRRRRSSRTPSTRSSASPYAHDTLVLDHVGRGRRLLRPRRAARHGHRQPAVRHAHPAARDRPVREGERDLARAARAQRRSSSSSSGTGPARDRPARGARYRGREPRDPARSRRDGNTVQKSPGIAVCSAREANTACFWCWRWPPAVSAIRASSTT